MQNYKAIITRDPGVDLTHFKYIKRETKGNKYVYTYPDDNVNGDNEPKSAADNIKEAWDSGVESMKKDINIAKKTVKELTSEQKQSIQNKLYTDADSKYKQDQQNAKSVKDYAKASVKRGTNATLKALNNIGDGKLDDKAIKNSKKVKKWFKKIFN